MRNKGSIETRLRIELSEHLSPQIAALADSYNMTPTAYVNGLISWCLNRRNDPIFKERGSKPRTITNPIPAEFAASHLWDEIITSGDPEQPYDNSTDLPF